MQYTKNKRLISVVGPTAVGKTSVAIALAQHFKTEIISSDSRQFYREMSIGTAKPSTEELSQATHHFINSHSISTIYTAGDFERDALALLAQLFEIHDTVIMVGGSGLFVRAVTEGLDSLPKAPDEIRNQLNQELLTNGLESLQARLKAIDPHHYKQLDFQNPQRVVRALEVYVATGHPISHFQQNIVSQRPFDVMTIGLNTERSFLYERINKRVDLMMEDGLLEEVKRLLPFKSKPPLLTVGYAELFDYYDGKASLETAVNLIKQNSRRYAKRQITWFKKYGNTNWFEPKDINHIIEFIEKPRD